MGLGLQIVVGGSIVGGISYAIRSAIARRRMREGRGASTKRGIVAFRAIFGQTLVVQPFRVVAESDVTSELALAEPRASELERHGFTRLGVVDDGDAVFRALVDPSGRCVAMLGIDRDRRRTMLVGHQPPNLSLRSGVNGETFITEHGNPMLFATAPEIHRQLVAKAAAVAEVVASHAALVGDRALTRVATPDDLLRLLNEERERCVAWRKAQPPDELIEADHISLYSEEVAAHELGFKLKLRVPRAKVRR
ncbi:MAG TPA: hypothetical protein VGC41_00865 [Kofleriaceae bacterium]